MVVESTTNLNQICLASTVVEVKMATVNNCDQESVRTGKEGRLEKQRQAGSAERLASAGENDGIGFGQTDRK
jgi:hypothetical protein